MDPNANLAEQRRIISYADKLGRITGVEAARLVELMQALDMWITSGGCLPNAWARKGGA